MLTSSNSQHVTRLLFGLPAVLRNGYWIVFSADFINLARIPENDVDSPDTYKKLLEGNFFSSSVKTEEKKIMHVTLILTSDCNLRCKYCFADSGSGSKKVIDQEIIFSSLRHAVKIAQGRKLSISFFGGEPTMQFGLIKKTVDFAKRISEENNLPCPEFSVTTNGVFGDEVHNFLVNNDFLVTLSADGPASIQNFQRPAIRGNSSVAIEKTLERFAESKHKIKIRATVTELSVNKMSDVVLWVSTFGLKESEIHFEPVSISGRARSSCEEIGKPAVSDFILNLKKAIETGNIVGVGVINSSFMNLVNSPSEFCESNINNKLAVTVDGAITSCVEVQDSCHPAAELFVHGEYDRNTKSFTIDKNGQSCNNNQQVIKFKSSKGSDCSLCFAKRICGGGCPVRNFHTTGQTNIVDPYRCEVTKEIIPYIYGIIDEASV